MRRDVQGKRILITGASSGIGREIAFASAAAGARLLITSNQVEKLRLVADELSAKFSEVISVPGDITSAVDRSAIFAAAKERFGALDILVNNAGRGAIGPFLDSDPADLRRIMEVNFFALTECCREGVRLLAGGEQPLIVNVSSMFGRRGVPEWSAYCGSKFAVCGFSESLRAELAELSIDVMLVLPGVTRTEFGSNLLGGTQLDLSSGSDPVVVAQRVLAGIRRNRAELRIGQDSKRIILINRLFPNRIFPSWLEKRLIPFARDFQRTSVSSGATVSAGASSAGRGQQTAVNWRSWRARRIQGIRAAERMLPETVFAAAIFPFVLYRSLMYWRRDQAELQAQRTLAEPVFRSATAMGILDASYKRSAMNLTRHWPDRLRQPRWRKRCRLFGEDKLRAAQATGRPVMLTTVHYGGLPILFYWLRSRGVPVAAMAHETLVRRDEFRLYYDSLADSVNQFPHVPSLFGTTMDDLYETREFLSKPGNALLIVLDVSPGGNPATIELEEGAIEVQLGLFSLAFMSNAIVLPCLIRADRRMGCEIHFGEAVPDELLVRRQKYPSAARHVLEQLVPLVRQRPEQSYMKFAERTAENS